MVNKESSFGVWTFFWIFLVGMITFNFVKGYFGLTNLYWHFFLHIGIIIFSFLILIYSLKLNEKATEYIIIGSLLWILVNSVLFLGHVFEEYSWVETNLFTLFGIIIGSLAIMFGFKEAVDD